MGDRCSSEGPGGLLKFSGVTPLLFIFSIHGLRFMASPDLPEAGGPVSGSSPQAAGCFLGATGPLTGLSVPWSCAGGARGWQGATETEPVRREGPRSSPHALEGREAASPLWMCEASNLSV